MPGCHDILKADSVAVLWTGLSNGVARKSDHRVWPRFATLDVSQRIVVYCRWKVRQAEGGWTFVFRDIPNRDLLFSSLASVLFGLDRLTTWDPGSF